MTLANLLQYDACIDARDALDVQLDVLDVALADAADMQVRSHIRDVRAGLTSARNALTRLAYYNKDRAERSTLRGSLAPVANGPSVVPARRK